MTSKNRQNCVPKFGEITNNYDWVECESKSNPGKFYYFNLKTMCKTWVKPVSRFMCLPRFSFEKNRSVTSSNNIDPLPVTDYQKSVADDNLHHENSCMDLMQDRNERTRKVPSYSSRLNDHQKCISSKPSIADGSFDCVRNNVRISSSSENRSISENEELDSALNVHSCCDSHLSEKSSFKRSKYAEDDRLQSSDSSIRSGYSAEFAQNKRVKLENRKPTIIICEMYGTRTINYIDDFTPDTLTKSKGSFITETNNNNSTADDDYSDVLTNIKNPNFSESSTSS